VYNFLQIFTSKFYQHKIVRFYLFYEFINYRYKKWLPDNVDKRHDTKRTYQVEIRYANNTNETFTFHGPPGNKRTIEKLF